MINVDQVTLLIIVHLLATYVIVIFVQLVKKIVLIVHYVLQDFSCIILYVKKNVLMDIMVIKLLKLVKLVLLVVNHVQVLKKLIVINV